MRKLRFFEDEYSEAESLDILSDLALSHAAESGPYASYLTGLIRSGRLREVVDFDLDYGIENLTAFAVYNASQVKALFSKIPDLRIGYSKEDDALAKFREAELMCKETNQIFRSVRSGRACLKPSVSAVLFSAQRKIATVLGPVPDLRRLPFRLGPGATRQVKRKEASARIKLAEPLQCSKELLPLVGILLGEMPALVELHEKPGSSTVTRGETLCVTSSPTPSGLDALQTTSVEWEEEWVSVDVSINTSKLGFVPKSAKALRSVNVEPGLNVMFQLGVGDYMAKRLAAFGLDIRDQTLNQRRAMEGSLTGALATLDLSSASDTISKEIVFELLPLDWATMLSYGRSGSVLLPNGEVLEQEKFSSMGNGYTFPLETLIFWALAASCCETASDASVYGDDIIVPVGSVPLLLEVLRVCGFSVNEKKSYWATPFRESCGTDYFRGTNVRPFFTRSWVNAQTLHVLHNFYVRRGDDERALWVRKYLEDKAFCRGPDGFGDGHLIMEYDKIFKTSYRARGFSGHFFETYVAVANKDFIVRGSDRCLPAYTVYRRSVDTVPVHRDYRFRANSEDVQIAPVPLPERDGCKGVSLPGSSGYKKVKVYILG